MVDDAPNEASLQVNPGVVGLAGLEPAASSLSEIDSQAPCYPAFALVVPLRKTYKDGVNLPIQSPALSAGLPYEGRAERRRRTAGLRRLVIYTSAHAGSKRA
jgi:hypothetical protein